MYDAFEDWLSAPSKGVGFTYHTGRLPALFVIRAAAVYIAFADTPLWATAVQVFVTASAFHNVIFSTC